MGQLMQHVSSGGGAFRESLSSHGDDRTEHSEHTLGAAEHTADDVVGRPLTRVADLSGYAAGGAGARII